MKDDKYYLILTKEYIIKIQKYTEEGYDSFLSDEKTQDAVIRKLQILAETTQRLSDNIKENEKDIPWQDIAGIRNILVHRYTEVNIPRIWLIIQNDLPILIKFVEENIDDCRNN
jgi:uncharacterized protein with HEPN domain